MATREEMAGFAALPKPLAFSPGEDVLCQRSNGAWVHATVFRVAERSGGGGGSSSSVVTLQVTRDTRKELSLGDPSQLARIRAPKHRIQGVPAGPAARPAVVASSAPAAVAAAAVSTAHGGGGRAAAAASASPLHSWGQEQQGELIDKRRAPAAAAPMATPPKSRQHAPLRPERRGSYSALNIDPNDSHDYDDDDCGGGAGDRHGKGSGLLSTLSPTAAAASASRATHAVAATAVHAAAAAVNAVAGPTSYAAKASGGLLEVVGRDEDKQWTSAAASCVQNAMPKW